MGLLKFSFQANTKLWKNCKQFKKKKTQTTTKSLKAATFMPFTPHTENTHTHTQNFPLKTTRPLSYVLLPALFRALDVRTTNAERSFIFKMLWWIIKKTDSFSFILLTLCGQNLKKKPKNNILQRKWPFSSEIHKYTHIWIYFLWKNVCFTLKY